MSSQRRYVLGVTGASGAPYAHRLLGWFNAHRQELDLDLSVVFTKFGRLVWEREVGTDPRTEFPFEVFQPNDMMAPFASGSALFDGMAILPSSAGTLSRIATGISTDLVARAADVMLKERRRLVVVVRESPYNLIQLRNMTTLVEAGATVMPASPTFYSEPGSTEEWLDTVVARVLDGLGLENDLMARWEGGQ